LVSHEFTKDGRPTEIFFRKNWFFSDKKSFGNHEITSFIESKNFLEQKQNHICENFFEFFFFLLGQIYFFSSAYLYLVMQNLMLSRAKCFSEMKSPKKMKRNYEEKLVLILQSKHLRSSEISNLKKKKVVLS
jgi:hypothetical protein